MMQEHPFFVKGKVVILAHRGFTPPQENTLGAFERAISFGADIVETDIHCSKDGIAVLCHDADLFRIAGIKAKLKELTWDELSQVELNDGSKLASLSEALLKFPKTKFNLDIKDHKAIASTVAAIEFAKAYDRVLVSSFSNKTRKKALSLFSRPVATSASSSTVITSWILFKLGKKDLSRELTGIGALQIPLSSFGMKLDNPKFIRVILASGTQLHYWTINDYSEMRRLIALGANGIVTDNTSLAIEALGKTS